ncbi:MAG: two component transcriptional regulator, LytTR family [Rariglobus sp.]|jgi:two-component system LytT family response regulator|nr:two component transcriptional regulator, LytTR family [Rariglobus sp.]
MNVRPSIRTLIVDDEQTARIDLRTKLALHPEVLIVGEAATLRAARALLLEATYDLLLLDVQLIGGDAFQLVPDVRPGARIIFVTAYNEHAVRAFEINALDYLLKPVDPARLARGLARLSHGHSPPEDDAPAARTGGVVGLDDTLYLRSGAQARFVRVGQIRAISSQDNYSEVLLDDGTRLLLRKSLKEWEDSLPADAFFRVHRTQIVNLTHVVRYQRDTEERTHLFFDGIGGPVISSRHRWNELKDRLAALHGAPHSKPSAP